jgi:phosphoglycolate phosphatase-like HAD superfamily hydrolase
MADARLLVLWDIDYTLIAAPGVGRMIYERAFPIAVGRPLDDLVNTAGRPDLDIMAATLKLHGLEPTPERMTALAKALVAEYAAAEAELRERGDALPGARETLAEVSTEPAIRQSVLTGNLRSVAELKLATFGLAGYVDFDSGAYGDDHAERAELVHIARTRAQHRTGTAFPGHATVLVGDTPRDVQAALSADAEIVAVATGTYPAEQLREAGAVHIADTVPDCLPILKSLLP